jgi:TRAP-type mannitol/chloroaromatic compound transport system substrate-binding protein
MINLDAWKKLPPDLQAIVEHAAMANMVWSYSKANWDAIGALDRFKGAGVKESELDREAQEKIEDLCIQFMEMEAAKNPDYAKIAKSIVDYLQGADKLRRFEGRFKSGDYLKRYPAIK